MREKVVYLRIFSYFRAYGESKILEIEELKGYIKNEINLLEKQRQIEVSFETSAVSNFKLAGKPP